MTEQPMRKSSNQYDPEWISPPGDTIRDAFEERGWDLDRAAAELDMSRGNVDEMLFGIMKIEPGNAKVLARVLGSTEEFWLERERLYRERLTRAQLGTWAERKDLSNRIIKEIRDNGIRTTPALAEKLKEPEGLVHVAVMVLLERGRLQRVEGGDLIRGFGPWWRVA